MPKMLAKDLVFKIDHVRNKAGTATQTVVTIGLGPMTWRRTLNGKFRESQCRKLWEADRDRFELVA